MLPSRSAPSPQKKNKHKNKNKNNPLRNGYEFLWTLRLGWKFSRGGRLHSKLIFHKFSPQMPIPPSPRIVTVTVRSNVAPPLSVSFIFFFLSFLTFSFFIFLPYFISYFPSFLLFLFSPVFFSFFPPPTGRGAIRPLDPLVHCKWENVLTIKCKTKQTNIILISGP